jgi:hypothetical protein
MKRTEGANEANLLQFSYPTCAMAGFQLTESTPAWQKKTEIARRNGGTKY